MATGQTASTARQPSESIFNMAILSVSGGLQDAYTYATRGGVFANAQTGNIVLLSQNLLDGDFAAVMRYLLPLASFSFGIAAAEYIRDRFLCHSRLHWRQVVLAVEILILLLVGFLPARWDLVANSMVSLACAMQVQAFRKIDGYAFASTMCIGNLRSGVESLYHLCRGRGQQSGRKAACYFGVILLFFIGAGLGCLSVPVLGHRTIWLSGILLLIAFCKMF